MLVGSLKKGSMIGTNNYSLSLCLYIYKLRIVKLVAMDCKATFKEVLTIVFATIDPSVRVGFSQLIMELPSGSCPNILKSVLSENPTILEDRLEI